MKITIKLEGYLKYKCPSNILELNYSKPVTIRKVLKDAKVSSADVFFIKTGDKIVKEDYLLRENPSYLPRKRRKPAYFEEL